MKTEAAILWDVRTDWSVEEVELDPPKSGEILIRLAASGLCHTDEHYQTGDIASPYPIVGGHEGAGVVEEVGPDVATLRVGDHVVLSFIPSCGRCPKCSTGHQNLCDLGAAIMTGLPITDGKSRVHARGQDLHTVVALGTFSPWIVAHESAAIKIDDDLPLDLAALVGCGVTTGYGSTVNVAQVRPGENVVVVGLGGLGHAATQAARLSGAASVIAVDPVEFKRESAQNFGATHVATSIAEAFSVVQDVTRGAMADAVITTVGVLEGSMVGPLLNLVAKDGRLVLTSVAQGEQTEVTLSLQELVFFQKQIRGNVYGGSNPRYDIPTILNLYRTGEFKLAEMVTRRYALKEINEAYQDLRDGRNVRGLIVY